MYSFHELPQDAIISLHSSLMQRLNEITEETNNLIVTQVLLFPHMMCSVIVTI